MSLSFSIDLGSLAKTRQLGKRIAQFCRGGEVIYLSGDLGAGKTTLVQAVAAGLNLDTIPNSPTFIMVNEYAIPGSQLVLVHADLYRVSGVSDLETLGLSELLGAKKYICFVEWPEQVAELEQIEHLHIRFIEGKKRLVKISGKGRGTQRLLKEIGYVYLTN